MKFKIGDPVEDRRYPSIKTVGVIRAINEYPEETFIHVAVVELCNGHINVYTVRVYHPEDLTLLVSAEPEPLFEIHPLAIPEVSSEHTL